MDEVGRRQIHNFGIRICISISAKRHRFQRLIAFVGLRRFIAPRTD